MEINITVILKLILIFASNFLICFYFYRYIFYPNLRWYQKGNICHTERREASFILAIVLAFIEICIYKKLIIFTF
jgi:Kef-type K+ transport system membrane component KefB